MEKRYLGVFLGNDFSIQKDWEGMADKVIGRLKKWRWLLPQLSFRGHTLIIINLAASECSVSGQRRRRLRCSAFGK